MRKSLPKNRVRRRYCSLPLRYQAVWKPATMKASEIVSGTKRKW